MSAPSPDLFLDAALGYQKTAAIKAAIALDLFTAIAQEGGVLDRVSARVGATSRGVRILCDYRCTGFCKSMTVIMASAPQPSCF